MEAMSNLNCFSPQNGSKTDQIWPNPQSSSQRVRRRSQIVVWESKPDCQRGAPVLPSLHSGNRGSLVTWVALLSGNFGTTLGLSATDPNLIVRTRSSWGGTQASLSRWQSGVFDARHVRAPVSPGPLRRPRSGYVEASVGASTLD